MRLFKSIGIKVADRLFLILLCLCIVTAFQTSSHGQARHVPERELMTTVTPKNCVTNWLELWKRAKAQNHVAQLSIFLLVTRGTILDLFDSHDEFIEFTLQVGLNGMLISNRDAEQERLTPYITYVISSVLAIIREYRMSSEWSDLAACLITRDRKRCINDAMDRGLVAKLHAHMDRYEKKISARPLKCRMSGF